MEAMDRVRQSGERTDLASSEARSVGKSAVETAEKLGVGWATVERVRAVMASDVEPVKEALRHHPPFPPTWRKRRG